MLQSFRQRKLALLLTVCLMVSLMASASVFAFGKGAKGPDVYAVQGMLKSLGYFKGTITGYYGSDTANGVKQFQKAYGLPATGAVDDATLQSILWAYGKLKLPNKPQPTPTPTPAPEKGPQPPSTSGLSAEEQRMVDLANQARAQAGLPALAVDPQLSKTARLKSKDMVNNDYFSHQSPTYGSPFEMMKHFGISYTTAGENIACNQDVPAAHTSLMNSPGHKANILNKEFTHIGVGIVDGGPCGKMLTQQFIGK